MTYQTNHRKLPILSFVCFVCFVVKKHNKPISFSVALCARSLSRTRSGMARKTKRTQTDRQQRVVPDSDPESRNYKTNPFCTNEPNFKITIFTITTDIEIAYDIQPSSGDQKNEPNSNPFLTKSVSSANTMISNLCKTNPKLSNVKFRSRIGTKPIRDNADHEKTKRTQT
jgi:hypothetical protein